MDVNLSDRGWLVLTDSFAEGWKAYLRPFGAQGEGVTASGEAGRAAVADLSGGRRVPGGLPARGRAVDGALRLLPAQRHPGPLRQLPGSITLILLLLAGGRGAASTAGTAAKWAASPKTAPFRWSPR